MRHHNPSNHTTFPPFKNDCAALRESLRFFESPVTFILARRRREHRVLRERLLLFVSEVGVIEVPFALTMGARGLC